MLWTNATLGRVSALKAEISNAADDAAMEVLLATPGINVDVVPFAGFTLCTRLVLALEAEITNATDAALLLTRALLITTGIGVIVSVVVEVVELFVEFPRPLPAPGMKPIGIALSPYPVPLGSGGSISVVPLPESMSQIA